MVEQSDVLLDKDNTQLLGSLEDGSVVLAATGCGNVLDARAGCTVYVVDKGELRHK